LILFVLKPTTEAISNAGEERVGAVGFSHLEQLEHFVEVQHDIGVG
jgi:hypothetical protein